MTASSGKADFISIGTNDLTQYLLAADRGAIDTEEDYSVLHPAVLRTIRDVVAQSISANKPVSVCGEAAGDPHSACLLAGLGVRQLSMSPARAARVRQLLRTVSIEHCVRLTHEALECATTSEVRSLLRSTIPDINAVTDHVDPLSPKAGMQLSTHRSRTNNKHRLSLDGTTTMDTNNERTIASETRFHDGQPHIPKEGAASESAPVTSPFYVVGVGASAGGLEALESFFQHMPADAGMAFVVVQHLSPDFKSLMDELLSRRTEIAIHRVEDGMAVEPNAIYLIPPKKEMIISGGRLLLTDKDPATGLSLPIDTFFRSLAQDCGERAVGIVLSGTGSDGSRGIRAIHDAGGLVIAQSEDTAKFDGMPRSASRNRGRGPGPGTGRNGKGAFRLYPAPTSWREIWQSDRQAGLRDGHECGLQPIEGGMRHRFQPL